MPPAWRGWSLACVSAIACGCLSPPDEAPAAADAALDADATPSPVDAAVSDAAGGCPTTVSIGFDDEGDVDGWGKEDATTCTVSVAGSLSITHSGEVPALCRRTHEGLVDLRDGGLAVEMTPLSGDLHMSFVVLLGQPGVDLDQRRAVYVEHNEG